jgi:Zn-dependent protease
MATWPDFIRLGTLANTLLVEAVHFTLFISLLWNLMNLVPVLPLDGGQISRELCTWINPRNGMDICLWISAASAGAIALWAISAKMRDEGVLGLDPVFLAFMFGYLACNWQT